MFKRRTFLIALSAIATLASVLPSRGRSKAELAKSESEPGFSFIAYGDSRPMMYLPYKEGDPKLDELILDLFNLVLPQKVAKEVVKKDVKLTFDPVTKDLIQIDMPSYGQRMRLVLDQGWVVQCTVEDKELMPGVDREMFSLAGNDWVKREIVNNVNAGRAKFVIDSGDVVWWGEQGRTLQESPYWQRVNNTMLSQLPPPDSEMLAAGLEGRWFVGIGNHEVWADPNIEGLLSTAPYLKKLGVSKERLTYKFDYGDARFIFLWSGKFDYRSPSEWTGDRPKYAEQMKQMQEWLDEAKAKGMRKAFITFHYPVFARSGFGAIPAPDNPHKLIAAYAKDMEIAVFNGHIHTTEVYDVDGVKYMMLGGGGAEQAEIIPGRDKIKVPADYPPDLYWKGQPRQLDLNYVIVDVRPGEETKFTLNRFRPGSATPFESVELFGSSE